MGENGLLQKMKSPAAKVLTGAILLTSPLLPQAEKATAESSLENKSGNTTIINNYYYPQQRNSQRFFINDAYWNFSYFNPAMNRVYFRRMQRGAWINFYLNINDLSGHGLYFNYQSNTPFYHNPHNNKFNNQGQFYNNQFFNQNNNYHPNTRNPVIRNNTGRNSRR